MATVTLHLTAKNCLSVVIGICVVGLAAIPLKVSPEHLSWVRWQVVIWGLCVLAIAALIVQAFMQSHEDQKRDAKELERDETQNAIKVQLAQLVSKETEERAVALVEPDQGILPLNPPVNFDGPQFFKVAYHSLMTEDVTRRVRIAASQNKAHFKPEDFYARLIGVGMVGFLHDVTWAYIWASQFLMLTELNRRGGNMAAGAAKEFYDHGAKEYPAYYTNYSFDGWLGFMQTQGLILRHPSEMLEITVRGRDFLSYSGHNSRTADQKTG